MDYLNTFQNWLEQTSIYQQFLKNMPPPINNIYFDTLCILLILVYVVYRFVERIRVTRYHRRIRERQAREQRERQSAEQELYARESVVRDKEERIGRFLDVMEFYYWNRGDRGTHGTGRPRSGFFSRIGRKDFLLADRGRSEAAAGKDEYVRHGFSDYDTRMRDIEESRRQEADFQESQRRVREQMDESMTILDEQLRVEQDAPIVEEADVALQRDRQYERRRAKTLKEIRREQRRAERLARKERRREKKHGMEEQV